VSASGFSAAPAERGARLLGRRVVVPAHLDLRRDQQRLHVLRCELQRFAKKPKRFHLLLLPDEQGGEIVVGLDVARVLRDRLSKRMLGFRELLVLLKQRREVVVCLGIELAVGQRVLIGTERAIHVAGQPQCVAQIVQGLSHIRPDFKGASVIIRCLFELAFLVLDDSEIVQRLRVLRVELDGLLERLFSLVEFAVLTETLTEIGMQVGHLRR
jgi:hypothetical protein